MAIHGYPSIYALGHRALADLLVDPVVVQEKVDGSQISFGVDQNHDLHMRSKGAALSIAAPDKMFGKGVEYVKSIQSELIPGWTYRGEYLAKPKHNALAYDRTPKNHIVLFDINDGLESYVGHDTVILWADHLGLEAIPLLHRGMVEDLGFFRSLLDRESFLGGQKIEGVVVKNYLKFGPDKKALMGKFVSEQFKEVHAREWKLENPNQGDVIQRIASRYTTAARWEKALIHLREAGKIEGSPRDIGVLVKEVWPDILKECEPDMRDELWTWAQDQIRRKVCHGLPEWYKQRLLELQFTKENDHVHEPDSMGHCCAIAAAMKEETAQ